MKIQMLSTSGTIIEQKILQRFCKRTIFSEVRKSLNVWVQRDFDFMFFINVTKIRHEKKVTEQNI